MQSNMLRLQSSKLEFTKDVVPALKSERLGICLLFSSFFQNRFPKTCAMISSHGGDQGDRGDQEPPVLYMSSASQTDQDHEQIVANLIEIQEARLPVVLSNLHEREKSRSPRRQLPLMPSASTEPQMPMEPSTDVEATNFVVPMNEEFKAWTAADLRWEDLYYYPDGYYWKKMKGTKTQRYWTEIDDDKIRGWWTIWWDESKQEDGSTKWTWRWVSQTQYNNWRTY